MKAEEQSGETRNDADGLLREAYGCLRTLLLAADVLDITEPAHAEIASAIETDMLEIFRRIEKYVETETTTSELVEPSRVLSNLHAASGFLSLAHRAASEREGERTDLNGPVRDALFGLTSAVDALAQMIEEGRFGPCDTDGSVQSDS